MLNEFQLSLVQEDKLCAELNFRLIWSLQLSIYLKIQMNCSLYFLKYTTNRRIIHVKGTDLVMCTLVCTVIYF
jgi:hypothetical protein